MYQQEMGGKEGRGLLEIQFSEGLQITQGEREPIPHCWDLS